MPRKKVVPVEKRVKADEVGRMAGFIFNRVRQIMREHPGVSERIDELETEVRERFQQIKVAMTLLEKHDRELVAALVINSLTETAEEVLMV
jgi:HAMP domain-containing protein